MGLSKTKALGKLSLFERSLKDPFSYFLFYIELICLKAHRAKINLNIGGKKHIKALDGLKERPTAHKENDC